MSWRAHVGRHIPRPIVLLSLAFLQALIPSNYPQKLTDFSFKSSGFSVGACAMAIMLLASISLVADSLTPHHIDRWRRLGSCAWSGTEYISFSCIGFALSGTISAYCDDAAWTESRPLFGCVYSVRQSKDQLLDDCSDTDRFLYYFDSFPFL